jgi:hypothetical protein
MWQIKTQSPNKPHPLVQLFAAPVPSLTLTTGNRLTLLHSSTCDAADDVTSHAHYSSDQVYMLDLTV